MQFRSLAFAAAVIATAVLTAAADAASNCTDSQMEDIEKLDDEAVFETVCPSNDDGSFDMESTDPKVWATISPCKDSKCAEFLKQQSSKVPDCDHDGVNMKAFYKEQLDLCVDLASGKLSSDEIKKRFANTTDDWAGSYGEWFNDDDEEEETKATATVVAATTKAFETNSTATTTTMNTTAPAKTPAPTKKKSSATTLVISGGVVAVTAALASLTVD